MVRELTNRANIRYRIIRYKGPGRLYNRAAELARALLVGRGTARKGEEEEEEDIAGARLCGNDEARIIVYYLMLDLVGKLLDELEYPMYTGDSDTISTKEKKIAINR